MDGKPTIEQIARALEMMEPGDFLKREQDGWSFQRYKKASRRDDSEQHWYFIKAENPVAAITRAFATQLMQGGQV